MDKFERFSAKNGQIILGNGQIRAILRSDLHEGDKFERILGPIYMKGTNSSDFLLNGQIILGKKVDKFKSCGNLGGQIKIACWNTPLWL